MPLNVSDIRQHNMARIFHALREQPDSSQRDLVDRTGLDQATVSVIVNQLEAAGLIERRVKPRRGRVGRPEHALRISRQAGLLLGASLEPGTIRLLATTLAGDVLGRRRVPGSRDPASALARLRSGASELVESLGSSLARVRGIGIGVPSIMDDQGAVVLAPNLAWHDLPLLPLVTRAFEGMPVYIDNDANAAALAEKLFGVCRDATDFLYLAGHSGVGGGLVLKGELYRGARGFAGEIGHMKVVPGGRPCACGGRGCLEAYLSEGALLGRLNGSGLDFADLHAVAAAASRGRPEVHEVLHEAGALLGTALASLVNIFNPQLVVLAGSLAVVAECMRDDIEQRLREDSLPGFDHTILVSPLGEEAVPMGGIALAMEGFFSQLNLPEARPRRSVVS